MIKMDTDLPSTIDSGRFILFSRCVVVAYYSPAILVAVGIIRVDSHLSRITISIFFYHQGQLRFLFPLVFSAGK
jgi:hypothetical protein